MRCTLLISDLLPPFALGGESGQDLRFPKLETLLARAKVVLKPALERDAWLCGAFGVDKQQDWPVAPLTLAADGVDPELHYWLRADPVELRFERRRLMMVGGVRDLEAHESRDLVAALNGHFARDGITVLAPVPGRWYLRTDRTPLITTTPLSRAANDEISRHLPRGDAALYWHRVINEAQMVLHEHAVNEAREARGAASANSIWLWGGGTVPAVSRAPYQSVWSEDALARSLAAAAGIAQHPLPGGGAAWLTTAAAAGDNHLLVFNQLSDALRAGGVTAWCEEAAMLERNWIAPLLPALRGGKISALTLAASNADVLLEATVTPITWWRLWRHKRPLAGHTVA